MCCAMGCKSGAKRDKNEVQNSRAKFAQWANDAANSVAHMRGPESVRRGVALGDNPSLPKGEYGDFCLAKLGLINATFIIQN